MEASRPGLFPFPRAALPTSEVEALDLSEAERVFHNQGRAPPAYAPKMLLKLVAYGYLTQRFSSRCISQACQEDLGFMWLAQVILRCMGLGMVGWKLGALDGSKVHSDASKHTAMSYGRMQTVIPQW